MSKDTDYGGQIKAKVIYPKDDGYATAGFRMNPIQAIKHAFNVLKVAIPQINNKKYEVIVTAYRKTKRVNVTGTLGTKE